MAGGVWKTATGRVYDISEIQLGIPNAEGGYDFAPLPPPLLINDRHVLRAGTIDGHVGAKFEIQLSAEAHHRLLKLIDPDRDRRWMMTKWERWWLHYAEYRFKDTGKLHRVVHRLHTGVAKINDYPLMHTYAEWN